MEQTAAFDVGIRVARGEYIVTMDGDLQNDPERYSETFSLSSGEKSRRGFGWRVHRKDPFLKGFFSARSLFLRFSSLLRDGIHDSGCSPENHKRECFEGLHYEKMRTVYSSAFKCGFPVLRVARCAFYPRKHGKQNTIENELKGASSI